MRQELKTILERLIILTGKNSNEVTILKARLSCTNCKNSEYPKSTWICKLYGPVPKEFVGEGCDSWINNIRVK